MKFLDKEELLFDNGWTFLSIKQIDSIYIDENLSKFLAKNNINSENIESLNKPFKLCQHLSDLVNPKVTKLILINSPNTNIYKFINAEYILYISKLSKKDIIRIIKLKVFI